MADTSRPYRTFEKPRLAHDEPLSTFARRFFDAYGAWFWHNVEEMFIWGIDSPSVDPEFREKYLEMQLDGVLPSEAYQVGVRV